MFKFNAFESSLRTPSKLNIKPSSPFLSRKQKSETRTNIVTNLLSARQKAKGNSNQVSTESICVEPHIDSGLESLSSNSSNDTVDCEVQAKSNKPVIVHEDYKTEDKLGSANIENGVNEVKYDKNPVQHVVSVDTISEPISGNSACTGVDSSSSDSNVTKTEGRTLDLPGDRPAESDGIVSLKTPSDNVLIACTEDNKTNIVLQNNNVLAIDVMNCKQEQGADHSLIINVNESGAEGKPLASPGINASDGKVTVKVVGEILKKDNSARNDANVEKSKVSLSNSKTNISEMILASELLRKSPKVTERKAIKKSSLPNSASNTKVPIVRKTSEPGPQVKPGKLPVNRKTSHDDFKPSQEPQQNGLKQKSSKLSHSEETLAKKLKPPTDGSKSETQHTLSSSSLESLQGNKHNSSNGEKDNSVEVWSDSISVMSEASTIDDVDTMQRSDKLKKNMSEEEAKNMRRRRIERNIAHNNNKGNIVAANISKFQNEIEKLKVSRKTSSEKIKLGRTDSKRDSTDAKAEPRIQTGAVTGNLLERKPSINAKHASKVTAPRAKPTTTLKSAPSNPMIKLSKPGLSLSTITIEQALNDAEIRKNGSQTYKDLSELLKENGEVTQFGPKESTDPPLTYQHSDVVNKEDGTYQSERGLKQSAQDPELKDVLENVAAVGSVSDNRINGATGILPPDVETSKLGVAPEVRILNFSL